MVGAVLFTLEDMWFSKQTDSVQNLEPSLVRNANAINHWKDNTILTFLDDYVCVCVY